MNIPFDAVYCDRFNACSSHQSDFEAFFSNIIEAYVPATGESIPHAERRGRRTGGGGPGARSAGGKRAAAVCGRRRRPEDGRPPMRT